MDLQKIISTIDNLILKSQDGVNSVIYGNLCKMAAEFCFKNGETMDGIYYLSESQGATLRRECCYHCDLSEMKQEFNSKKPCNGLKKEYLSFISSYAKNKTKGLLCRLKEMPKEWTLIQLIRSYDPNDRQYPVPANSITNMTGLHIVRYSCGNSDELCHVWIPEPKSEEDGTVSILQLLYESVMDKSLHRRMQPLEYIRKKRKQNCEVMKSITKEITVNWLQEWSCFLLGRICDEKLEKEIKNAVDEVFCRSKLKYSCHVINKIYQIANGCAHLCEEEIELAVSETISDKSLQNKLVKQILRIKSDNPNIYWAKRYPVILLIDEKLECIPWEMIEILKNHPVSRLPSIHFVHALFKEHENTIINGNKIIKNISSGFYIVNPDLTLENTEKRIIQFLKTRFPKWCGLAGKIPSKNEFMDALIKYNILLYCGHGNGTQYFNSYDIKEIRVNALPFLFGCSSVQSKNLGGRAGFISLSHNYFISATPCILGMLWSVTNTDTDYMALILLNHWLPGKSIDITEIKGFNHQLKSFSKPTHTEPELLRVLNVARESAALFTNGCAMVVYGIPVKLEEE